MHQIHFFREPIGEEDDIIGFLWMPFSPRIGDDIVLHKKSYVVLQIKHFFDDNKDYLMTTAICQENEK